MRKSRIGRVVATGLGLALAGGMSLLAVAPAQAATETYVTNIDPSSILPSGSVAAESWFVQDGSAQDAFTAVPSGLELHGASGVAQGFGFNSTIAAADLSAYLKTGALSWTTTQDSKPANLEIMLDARSVDSQQESRLVILTPARSIAGKNTVSLDSLWTTNASIARDDDLVKPDFAAGDQASLADFLSADGVNYVSGFGLVGTGAGIENSVVTAATWPQAAYPNPLYTSNFTFLVPLKAGTLTVTGKAEVGQTLTATAAGWPEGTDLSYQWFRGQLYNSGLPIAGATGSTYKIVQADAGMLPYPIVTGTKAGFAPATVYGDRSLMVPNPIAPAPATDSSKLDSYLANKGVQRQTQTATGLPEGKLDASKEYTADVAWTGADSYVDAYLYSTPTNVGTFPVIDGKAQITLSPAVLKTLEGDSHTLVVTGQTSGAIQAFAVAVAPAAVAPAASVPGPELTVTPAGVQGPQLAETGFSLIVPLSAAALLLLAGAALAIVRRRMTRSV